QGPGDYSPTGAGVSGYIKKTPNLTGAGSVVTVGDNSFWDQYREHPGTFATPNASTLHKTHPSGWDPNVWNSARCDTSEINLYAYQGIGIQGGPTNSTIWMSTYHENDPHFNVLGQTKNRCFIRCKTCAATDIICDGTDPTDNLPGGYLPVGTSGKTKESTKIIPD